MPVYDYECGDCKKTFEYVCRVADRPEVLPCPKCGARARQVILRGPAVFGQELTPDQRKYAHYCLENQRMVKAKKAKPIETRSEYEAVCRAKQINFDRDIKNDHYQDIGTGDE